MQTVLVDTDVAIDFLRGQGYARDLLLQLWNSNAAHLSILSAYELYAAMREEETEETERFIDACTVEPVTREIARLAGETYRNSRRKGVSLTPIDCLISATARQSGQKIATRNNRHYPDNTLFPL